MWQSFNKWYLRNWLDIIFISMCLWLIPMGAMMILHLHHIRNTDWINPCQALEWCV